MNAMFSRREFFKMAMVGAATVFVGPKRTSIFDLDSNKVVRVATTSVSVYSEPSDESKILFQHYRDELVNYYYEIISPHGPGYNPKWYRVWGGYMHSAHLQKVKYKLNTILPSIENGEVIAEVTVPYTQVMWNRKKLGWEPLYRYYYKSMHWIAGINEGPDGELWYKIHDELLDNVEFYVRAEHIRPIPLQNFSPISTDIEPWKKRIEVVIATQTLTAYEGDNIVLQTKISSGLPDYGARDGEVSTNTPRGEFNVYSKMPSKHMGDGNLTSDPEAYELPGVPWATFFAPHGVAFHGTYWHDNYGVPMSHGCINMKPEEAQWVFRWTLPDAFGDKIEQVGNGTRVIVS